MKKLIAMLLSLVMILSLFAGCGNDKPAASEAPKAAEESKAADATNAPVKPVVIKYSTAESPTSVLAQVMTDLIAEVDEKSNGTIIFEPYYSNELGSLADVTEQMTLGGNLMANASGDFYATYGCPDILSSALFYAVPDKEALQKLNASDLFASWCDQIEEASGIKILCCNWAAAPRNIISTKPINSVADIKGLKIRVQDMKSQTDMMSYLGGIPVAMSYGDVYTSLQTGIIDGTENNETALTTGKHGEVCKVYSVDQHAMIPDVLIMSEKVWKTISPEDQQILLEAAHDSTDAHKVVWDTAVEEAVNYLTVYEIVRERMAVTQRTIERVAMNIIEAVYASFRQVRHVKCTVSKLAPPLGGKLEKVSVVLEK